MSSQFIPASKPIQVTDTNVSWVNLTIEPSGSPSPSPSGNLMGDVVGPLDQNSVIKINSNPLGSTNPDPGNILVADGTQWNSVHPSGVLVVTPSGSMYLQPTGVVSGVYGDPSGYPVVTVGSDGRITQITELPVSGIPVDVMFRPSLLLMGG